MKPDHEFIRFCDESDRRGRFYSNFYGGVMVGSSQYQRTVAELETLKKELNLGKEVKWERISEPYAEKYIVLIRAFLAAAAEGRLRIRIMFRPTGLEPPGLTHAQQENEYFLLYYQFIKHGFGLTYVPPSLEPKRLRLYFDQFPDTGERVTQFRGYLLGLPQHPAAAAAGFRLASEDIAEVRSHEHVLLQCLDVVLGAMTFRLNNKHRELVPGTRRRGKRTRAKEKVYRAIVSQLQTMRRGFNIGVSTAVRDLSERWTAPYLHWCFVSDGANPAARQTKQKKAKDPTGPTS